MVRPVPSNRERMTITNERIRALFGIADNGRNQDEANRQGNEEN